MISATQATLCANLNAENIKPFLNMCRLSIWRIKRPFEDKLGLVQSVHYTPSQKSGPGRGGSTVKVDKGAKIAQWGQSGETSGWQQPRGMR